MQTLHLFFSGSNQDLVAQAARYYASAGTPCALLADSSLEVPDAEKCSVADGAPVSLIAAAEPETLVKALARWLVDATPKGIAVCCRISVYTSCRGPRTRKQLRLLQCWSCISGSYSWCRK